jgi:lipopolysaccharide export LptBFGC system permease protein LptF
VQAHAAVWVGALLMIVAAARGVGLPSQRAGYLLVLGAGLGYAAVAIWHFYEHSQLRDPDLPHVLLLVTNILMFIGAGWVWLARPSAQTEG